VTSNRQAPALDQAATATLPPTSALRATFTGQGSGTALARVHETGALRLRVPRNVGGREGVILNTGGGVLGGDRLDLAFDLAPRAEVTITTVAAEKIYRSDGPAAAITTRLAIGSRARLDWLPQETILFDRARLVRRLAIDMAADSTLLAAEMVVFGRLAMGETAIVGSLRDGWRLTRAGRLVFADETRLEGAIAATLDRPALGGGARASALVLLAAPDPEPALDPLRDTLAAFVDVAAGASIVNGILIARLLARSPERLRAAMVAALRLLRDRPPPRVWQ
jgi:urease accessory protein